MAASSVSPRAAVTRLGVLPIAALTLVVLLLALALGTYLYDHSRRDVIAKGVSVGGVPVGGLREAAARQKLERDLLSRLNERVTVRSGSQKWTLAAHQAQVRVDVENMLDQALERKPRRLDRDTHRARPVRR